MAYDRFRGLIYDDSRLECGCCRCCGCSCLPKLTVPCAMCGEHMVSGTDSVEIKMGRINTPVDRYDQTVFDVSTRAPYIICMPCADAKLRELFTTEDDIPGR